MQCEAEVRRLIERPTHFFYGGSRQVNTYEYGRCSRDAVSLAAMYPPRNEVNAMHPTDGHVCKQHAQSRLPRKAVIG